MPWTLTDLRTVNAIDQLDELGVRQLAVAGQKYDGEELPAADRLAGHGPDVDEVEGNLMECHVRKIVDGDTHLYDVWAYMVDSGSIFVASTTDVVAEICQFGLQCDDAELRAKLHPVLKGAGLISFD